MSTEKTPLAVALEYEKPGTPRVAAIGRGELARRIVALADAHGVPVTARPELAVALSQVELDAEIPVELYRAVAEVLVFILRTAGALRGHPGIDRPAR